MLGKRARITADNLGAMDKTTGRMVERTFSKGTVVTVTLRMPDRDRFTDWYALEVEDDPTIYIPAHVSMFSVEDASGAAMDATFGALGGAKGGVRGKDEYGND